VDKSNVSIDRNQSCIYILPDGEAASARFFTIRIGWRVYWKLQTL